MTNNTAAAAAADTYGLPHWAWRRGLPEAGTRVQLSVFDAHKGRYVGRVQVAGVWLHDVEIGGKVHRLRAHQIREAR